MSRIVALVFVLAAAACGGAETPADKPQPQPESQPVAAANDPHSVCVQSFQRQRECTAEFIPALVDARVRRDAPPGIAAKDKELGRDQLVAMALEEWKADSTDEAIEQTCTDMASKMPPDQLQGATERLGECLGAEACGAFVDCLIPVIEQQLR
jgi:hypothetical protein